MSTLRRQPSDPEDGFWPDNTQERSFWEEAAGKCSKLVIFVRCSSCILTLFMFDQDLPIECESDTAPYYAPAERSSTLSREVPRPDSNPSPSKRKTEILQRGEVRNQRYNTRDVPHAFQCRTTMLIGPHFRVMTALTLNLMARLLISIA